MAVEPKERIHAIGVIVVGMRENRKVNGGEVDAQTCRVLRERIGLTEIKNQICFIMA